MATKQNDDVTFKRPEYEAHENQVTLVNMVYGGIDTARTLIYKTPNENLTDYQNRLAKATLNNFVERIVTTMGGQIFRKPLSYEDIPQKIIDNSFPKISGNKNLNQFAKDLSELGIRDGKSYILVDIPSNGGDPYFSTVERSQLINWEKDDEGNFTMAVIAESYVEDTGAFSKEIKEQYRHIKPDGNVDIYREGDTKDAWDIETIETSYNFVPLYELDTGDVPPLYDIAVMNINYLNSFSKKDQYLDTAGSPIPFGKGLGIEGENNVLGEENDDISQPALVLGVNSVVLTDNVEASFEWVEMSGGSIGALQDDLERKATAMSERAIAIMSESTKTATQTNAENSESDSRLSDIAEDTENTLNNAYNAWHKMKYTKDKVGDIIVNRDFNLKQIDSGLLSGLNALQLSGNISKRTLLQSLIKNEVVDIESIDDEIKQIEAESLGETDNPAGEV